MTRKLIGLIIASLVTGSPISGEAQSSWNDQGQAARAVRAAANGVYGDYLHSSMSLADAFGSALGIPDGDHQAPADRRLLLGCRQHSCDEKAAVLLDTAGRVRAAGLIHFNCTAARRSDTDSVCMDAPVLTVLLPDIAEAEDREVILSWARSRVSSLVRIETIQPAH